MVLMGEGQHCGARGVRCKAFDDRPVLSLCAIIRFLAWIPSDRTFRCLGAKDNATPEAAKAGCRDPSRTCIRGLLAFCLRRADAMRLWTWPMRSWTAMRCLELAGQYGVDLALTGHGGGHLPRGDWAMVDADDAGARAGTRRGARRVSGGGQRVQYKARTVYGVRYRACGRSGGAAKSTLLPGRWPRRSRLALLWRQWAWGFPPTLVVQEIETSHARCSTCCPRISRSSAA